MAAAASPVHASALCRAFFDHDVAHLLREHRRTLCPGGLVGEQLVVDLHVCAAARAVEHNHVGMFKVGGEEWRQSREVLYRTIMDLQNPTGYWNPEDGTERQAGRVYSTSLAVLALAIEYGFLPIYQR